MEPSSVETRILASRPVLTGTANGDSLQNLIPSIYPDGALVWVEDQAAYYYLAKRSTAAVSAPTVIATALGAGVPGRWVRYSVGSDTITPLPAVIVLDLSAPPGGNGAYSGDKAVAKFADAINAVPDNGTIQVAPGDYRSQDPATFVNKGLSIVGLGGRGAAGARLPDLDWSVTAVEQLFLEKLSIALLGTQQIGIQVRDSTVSSEGVGCLASISITNGAFDGHAQILSAESAGIGDVVTSEARFVDCELSGNIIATSSVFITGCLSIGPIAITSPSIVMDAVSYGVALAAGVTFSSTPSIISSLPSATISVVVPALGANELGYVDVSTAGTVLEGIAPGDMVAVNPTADLAAAGADGGFVGTPRVSAGGTIRVPFKGTLAGGAQNFIFSKVS